MRARAVRILPMLCLYGTMYAALMLLIVAEYTMRASTWLNGRVIKGMDEFFRNS